VSVRNDYKPDSTWKNRRQVRRHGLLVITLVLIGLFGSVLAYISKNKPGVIATPESRPTASREVHAERHQAPPDAPVGVAPKPKYDFYKLLPERQVVINKDEITARTLKQDMPLPVDLFKNKATPPVTSSTTPASGNKPAPATPSPATAPKPGSASPLPATTGAKPSQPTSASPVNASIAPPAKTSGYMIQAGTFRNQAEADRRKASLALMGITARIEPSTAADGSTLHRVRIGPLRDYDQVQELLQRLQENNIQSIPLKTN
jgi:cell division protein FtsN